ncbi:hypothetical protein MKW94_018238, partial [Papaver nudicaule]|nr:hypothetical protein [Papaver nudicaule]
MFVNDKWVKSRFATELVGKNVLTIVTSLTFWEDVEYACKLLKPLVKVVRLVDIEFRPTMPYFYESMRIARDQLRMTFSEDKRWKRMFNHPLHCAAYYLNPSIFYKIPPYEMDSDPKYVEIKRGLHDAMEKLIHNEADLDAAKRELRLYSDHVGILGSPSCIRARDRDQPHEWWITYGGMNVPHLAKFAIRVLSLTSSSSPCERNWSMFQNVTFIFQLHSKKRNRITQQKLNDSVFIQYNKNLQRRYNEIQEYQEDGNARDPIFLDERDESDEWLDLQNLEDLARDGNYVAMEESQEIAAEENVPVGRRGAREGNFPTDSEIDAYDTDQLLMDTERGFIRDESGERTLDDDIYNED